MREREREGGGEAIDTAVLLSDHSLCPLHLEDEVVITMPIQVLDSICSILSIRETHKCKTLQD